MYSYRHLAFAAVCLAPIVLTEPAFAGAKKFWDGTWSGAWGNISSTSVTIKGNRVVSYKYQGQPVPITHSEVGADRVTFGASTYTVNLVKSGDNAANADYVGANGNAVAALTRQ